MLGPEQVVGRLVQRDAVPLFVLPPVGRDRIEAGRRQTHRLHQERALFGGRFSRSLTVRRTLILY